MSYHSKKYKQTDRYISVAIVLKVSIWHTYKYTEIVHQLISMVCQSTLRLLQYIFKPCVFPLIFCELFIIIVDWRILVRVANILWERLETNK